MGGSHIESVLQEQRSFPPPPGFAARAGLDGAALEALHRRAERDYVGFWGDLAREQLHWHRPFSETLDDSQAPNFRWFCDRELHAAVCRLANALRTLGVQRGDRVVIYLPLVPEAVIAMQACARIGAIHSVVFGGFSALSLRDRIADAGAKLVITADGGQRGGQIIPL